jgi:uncharacterized protein YcbK (DUF882 family)
MNHDAAARRSFLRHKLCLAAAATLPAWGPPALAAAPGARRLALMHAHTHERIDLVFAVDEFPVPQARLSLNRFLRDHYTGDIGTIDPQLFELLHRVQQLVARSGPFEVISGYRCPVTNVRLHQTRGGGAVRHSLHMEGRAIDVRLPGVALEDLRDAAVSLRAGGVGYYRHEQFVHLDTGRVRRW